MKHSDIISKMTLTEKASFCDGYDYWHFQHNDRFGIKSIMLTDGPHGLRKKKDKKTKGELMSSVPATCFPPAVTTASSWDRALIYKMGCALGEECLEQQVSVLLGPGVNMKRSPLCGRNFEYFSEDPFLAGEMAASFINGVQSKGIGTSLKHFATNNQETRRMTVDSVVDERALHEIYLPAFESAVKKAQPWTVMNAYNRLNGEYCGENSHLLTDILRKKWGYEGVVITDWGAENDRVAGLKAGQEVEMPSSSGRGQKAIIEAVQNGDLDEKILDEAVDKIIDLIFKASENKRDFRFDKKEHHSLARKIASESAVLLKNKDGLLPVDKNKNTAIIGEMAKAPRYQGAGSSLINPTITDNAFDELLNNGISMTYSRGYNKKSDKPDYTLINEAVANAKKADIAVVFIGLTEEYEAEGFDRTHMCLPESHNELVKQVASVNENTVVVLSGGAPVSMPWIDSVKAVLNGYLGGQAGGSAIVDVLLGKVNPSGKLAETYPFELSDNPSYNYFPGTAVTTEYRESIYIGYRYYDKAKRDVLFPFGFGLSYTDFEYSAIRISRKNIKDTDSVTVSFRIKNTGSVAGAEVAQVYVTDSESTIFRPEKELKGFEKIYLEPGEEKSVKIELTPRAFSFYNINTDDWQTESGEFIIKVGASSRDIRLETKVNVTSDNNSEIPDYRESAPSYYSGDIKNVPDSEFEAVLGRTIPPCERDKTKLLDLTSTLEDAYCTKSGKFIDDTVNKAIDAFMSDDDSNKGMIKAMALQIPVRNFVAMSMGVFTEKSAEGLLDILNGNKIPKGILKIIGGLGNAVKNLGNLFNSI